MKGLVCAAFLASAAIATTAAAQAAVAISVNFGDVAAAYSDGYYDSHHHWHHWRAGEWDRYRHAHPHQAHAWRHDDPHHH
jgi:opacity protein-like surface antigen